MTITQKNKKVFIGASVFDGETHSFAPAAVVTEGDRITEILPTTDNLPAGEHIDCRGLYMIPGLIDIHSHGRLGLDFISATRENLSPVLADYARVGTTSIMPTLCSATYNDWYKTCQVITDHAKAEYDGAHIVGVHLEGRYLCEAKRGAHAKELLTTPSVSELTSLLALLKGMPVHIAIAPELNGSETFIRTAVQNGATVSIAHTNCTYEQAVAATEWGASSFTHTFNAMSSINHRAPGCMTAALLTDSAYAELICDGVHSHPAMTKLLIRTKPRDRVLLITDSMIATGFQDGEYFVGGLPVIVKDGRAMTTEGAIAGSTISLFEGIKNCMKFADLPLEEVLPFATVNPARLLGISDTVGTIAVGMRADLLFIDNREDPTLKTVVCGGKIIR